MLLNIDLKLCVVQLAIIIEMDKELLTEMETARQTCFLADKRRAAQILEWIREAENNLLAILIKFNTNQMLSDRGEMITPEEAYRRYYGDKLLVE